MLHWFISHLTKEIAKRGLALEGPGCSFGFAIYLYVAAGSSLSFSVLIYKTETRTMAVSVNGC